MLIAHLHNFFTAPNTKPTKSQWIFWFSLSLTFATLYGLLGLRQAFSSEYVVQDDARQHVFWMQRFLDPQLFPNDLITDYFQSVAPAGYTAFYQLFAGLGINPLLLNKLLPILIGLITTGYCFGCVIQILPVPFSGFVTSLLLNQNLWMKDDLVSATPRAFFYPLFTAFLYYLLRRSLLPAGVTIVLLGLFYPQSVFLCIGILILQWLKWRKDAKFGIWHPYFSQDRGDYLFCGVGLAVALLVMLPYALKTSEFGPIITGAEARKMLEFSPKGRSDFFLPDSWKFWLYAQRSGFFPLEWSWLPFKYFPVMFAVGLSLPMLAKFPLQFPLIKQLKTGIFLLPQVGLASLAMFIAAHAVLFKLHLPSRYSQHSLRIVMAMSAGIAITVILDALLRKVTGNPSNSQKNAWFLFPFIFIVLILLFYPNFVPYFPRTAYKIGQMPALYEFFQQQPKDIVIASLADEIDRIPTFAQRSIWVGNQYAIPYHLGYYRQFRQRVLDLIRAQYSLDLAEVKNFIQTSGIDFWLLDKNAFKPNYVAKNKWVMQYQPAAGEAIEKMKDKRKPILENLIQQCSVFDRKNLIVLSSDCILKAQEK
ncbi:MAG: hypothetical protein KME19_00885 [Microcoleus vaginatus WJT46-NPBG5]|jgi:hypothetical protein|nr:hypothetical protein [Microcoleus vaginatus WJT46-NPBG5]